MTVRHRWRSFANQRNLAEHLHIGRASAALGRRRQDRLAIGAAVGSASSRSFDQPQLSPGQRRTLETGSVVVLSGLGLGVQFGSWPAWSILAGVGIYFGWVILYAEITVQKKRRPALFQRWRWHGRPRSRGRPRPSSAWIRRQVGTALARVDSVDRAGLRARFVGWRAGRHPADGAPGRFSPPPMIDPGQPTRDGTLNLAQAECTIPTGHDLPIGARAVKS
jgi:hypothetical protein